MDSRTIKIKLLNWYMTGEVGDSSETIARVVAGHIFEKQGKSVYAYHPCDRDDFNRCFKLVEAIPDIKRYFPQIAQCSPYWRAIILNWDYIVKDFSRVSKIEKQVHDQLVKERYEKE